MSKKSWFNLFAKAAAHISGRPATLIVALALIATWAVSGPLFRFGDTWQLAIKHQHDDGDVPDGVPDPEHSKLR